MEAITKKIIEVNFMDLPHVEFPDGGRFGLIVRYHNINYKFLVNIIKNSDKLIALGAGALGINSQWDRARPRFSRWSWDFEDSTISYDDPTLYIHDDILGSWGIGDEKNWYLKDISKIIKIISEKINIKRNNLIFYGSSAGGFTSLILATLIRDSIAVAEIPQFDITTYGVNRHWVFIKKHCFNNQDDEIIISKYSHRFKVIECMKQNKYIPNAFIILDATESKFISQGIPFFKQLHELPFHKDSNSIRFYIHGQNLGHMFLYKEKLLPLFKKIKLINDINSGLIDISEIYRIHENHDVIKFDSCNLSLPKEFYIINKGKTDSYKISNGEVDINIIKLNGKWEDPNILLNYEIQKYFNEKRKYSIKSFTIIIDTVIIHKTILKDNEKIFLNYWFVKNNNAFRFHTTSINFDMDDIIKMIVLSIK